jgi:DNA modification methylase
MEIVLRNIAEIKNYENNARLHPDDQIAEIMASIKNFGFNDPIEIDKDDIIISGHGRLAAALKLGLKEIPTIKHEHLTDTQRKAYILAANRIAMNSSWNNDLLRVEFLDIKNHDLDLSLTGFTQDEIDDILDIEDELMLGLSDENSCDEPEEQTVSKPGDLWILGEHRLLCGSSTIQTDVDKLFAGESPDIMITDPPYGVKYEASWRADAKGRKKTEREKSSNLMNDDQADWYDAYALFPGSVAYVWHASSFTDVVMDGLRRAGFEVKQQIIWNKNIHALSRSDYHRKHEPCWYAVKKGADRNWLGGRKQMTVWDVSTVQSEKDKTAHPTQKTVEIYLRSIMNHTKQGDYIYDPFSGSGTLIIACEKTGRRALSMELDPRYADVIIKRWMKFTGKQAILEQTGETFNEYTKQIPPLDQ